MADANMVAYTAARLSSSSAIGADEPAVSVEDLVSFAQVAVHLQADEERSGLSPAMAAAAAPQRPRPRCEPFWLR
jgi:hypothetical protein